MVSAATYSVPVKLRFRMAVGSLPMTMPEEFASEVLVASLRVPLLMTVLPVYLLLLPRLTVPVPDLVRPVAPAVELTMVELIVREPAPLLITTRSLSAAVAALLRMPPVMVRPFAAVTAEPTRTPPVVMVKPLAVMVRASSRLLLMVTGDELAASTVSIPVTVELLGAPRIVALFESVEAFSM